MNQIAQGTITKPYGQVNKERYISFEIPIKGFGKMTSMYSLIKRVYEKSFLHDFQNVLTSRVE